jgi:protein-tyrosine phosphatase
VCVHCWEGKSRSGLRPDGGRVCVAYLCVRFGLNFDDALARVERARPEVEIYPLYAEQTRRFVASGYPGASQNTTARRGPKD